MGQKSLTHTERITNCAFEFQSSIQARLSLSSRLICPINSNLRPPLGSLNSCDHFQPIRKLKLYNCVNYHGNIFIGSDPDSRASDHLNSFRDQSRRDSNPRFFFRRDVTKAHLSLELFPTGCSQTETETEIEPPKFLVSIERNKWVRCNADSGLLQNCKSRFRKPSSEKQWSILGSAGRSSVSAVD